MKKIHYLIIAIIATMLITPSAYMAGSLYATEKASKPIVEEIPPIVIKVDNVGCVIAEEPTLIYYVTTDTVRVNIECDSDILFNYLPAVE